MIVATTAPDDVTHRRFTLGSGVEAAGEIMDCASRSSEVNKLVGTGKSSMAVDLEFVGGMQLNVLTRTPNEAQAFDRSAPFSFAAMIRTTQTTEVPTEGG